MEKVIPVDSMIFKPLKGVEPSGRNHSASAKYGVIKKTLATGYYVVSLESDREVTVNGPGKLKVGDTVQVLTSQVNPEKKMVSSNMANPLMASEKGFQWSALIPLAFGGQGSLARIESFVEKKKKGTREKEAPAIFFIFTVQTENQREIQWSVYLRGRQVAIQVYATVLNEQKGGYQSMVREVEANLKQRGFVFVAPTIFLNRPFKVPPGFSLNVQG